MKNYFQSWLIVFWRIMVNRKTYILKVSSSLLKCKHKYIGKVILRLPFFVNTEFWLRVRSSFFCLETGVVLFYCFPLSFFLIFLLSILFVTSCQQGCQTVEINPWNQRFLTVLNPYLVEYKYLYIKKNVVEFEWVTQKFDLEVHSYVAYMNWNWDALYITSRIPDFNIGNNNEVVFSYLHNRTMN